MLTEQLLESFSEQKCSSKLGWYGTSVYSLYLVICNSPMTLSFHLEIWLKITAHPLPKGSLWVKYNSDWALRGEKICFGQAISHGQTEGRMEGWKDRQRDKQTN